MTEDEIQTKFKEALRSGGSGKHAAAARHLDIATSSLSMMLSGKAKLPLPRAIQLAEFLDLELTLQPRLSSSPMKR